MVIFASKIPVSSGNTLRVFKTLRGYSTCSGQNIPDNGNPLIVQHHAAGGGSSATRRMEVVSSSSWKWGRRNTTAL